MFYGREKRIKYYIMQHRRHPTSQKRWLNKYTMCFNIKITANFQLSAPTFSLGCTQIITTTNRHPSCREVISTSTTVTCMLSWCSVLCWCRVAGSRLLWIHPQWRRVGASWTVHYTVTRRIHTAWWRVICNRCCTRDRYYPFTPRTSCPSLNARIWQNSSLFFFCAVPLWF